ncbi:MAG TPA: amidohydrolase family protein [Acidimicrobiales bacterium]|jgi:N-acyl-D-aspartate/D-glutamate deacylase|nr:amidohydrolase family protein [Acidimicrobiales bacterium]
MADQRADLAIRGGTLIDGTGAPGVVADVGVTDGRIVALGDTVRGDVELDASGHVVAPGFIDIHTHYDAQVFWDPALTPSAFHGVTTVVAGNCGFSIAPVTADGVELVAHTLQHVEDMSFDTLRAGVPWDRFETFADYLDAVEGVGVGLNFGCYVGHTAVRLFVMGDDAYERPATDAELARMAAVVDDAMAAGAMGFASSASPTHNGDRGRPVPSRVGDLTELRALLEPLRQRGKGVVALLPGGVFSNAEVFDLQRQVGRPFTWTALLTLAGIPYHEKVVAEHDQAWDTGVEVWPQVSCRPLTFQINLREPFTLNTRPAFQALMAGTDEQRIAAYRDPAWRERAWAETGPGSRVAGLPPLNWHDMFVAECASRPELEGRRVEELASERGVTPLDALLDVALADDLDARFTVVFANNDPDAIAWLLPRDHVLLGLADSGAHLSQLCDACFATDLLGNWVRERAVMPLERAIHKLTGEPASVYGLADRGEVAVGKAADLAVFEPGTVDPGPVRRVRDLPADGDRLTYDSPAGMRHVLVNGTAIRRDGEQLPLPDQSRPGVVLR